MDLNAVVKQSIRSSAAAWFSRHGKIYLKDRSLGVKTPKPNYLQNKIQAVLDRFDDLGQPRRLIVLKPRQKGSTTFLCAVDYHFIRKQAASAVVIGGEYSQTKEAWAMMETYAKHDTFDWGNTGGLNQKAGSWSHGSKLKPETAQDVRAGISGTYQVLHATEVARWQKFGIANADEVLTNILKCIPLLPETLITLESTAEGASGAFHARWLTAVDAEAFLDGSVELQPGQYVRCFAPWFEFDDSAIKLTPQQKKEIERTIDDNDEFAGEQDLINVYGRTDEHGVQHLGTVVNDFDVWEQLAWRRWSIREECKRDLNIFNRDYPHSWQSAFQHSGNLRFNATGISVLKKRVSERTPMTGILEEAQGRIAFRPTSTNESTITIFERPNPGMRYILPIDPMTGITQVGGLDPDYHSAWILRAGYWDNFGRWTRPATAARIVQCRWDIDVLELNAWRLARYYGPRHGCKIVIEMNQDRGITELLKVRGADLYQRQIFNQREQKTAPALGIQTNTKTRETMIEGLATAIREWDTPGNGIDIFCPLAIRQLESFVKKDNGRSEHAEGHKDDDVFGIALGFEVIEHATTFFPEIFGRDLPPDLQGLSGRGPRSPSTYS